MSSVSLREALSAAFLVLAIGCQAPAEQSLEQRIYVEKYKQCRASWYGYERKCNVTLEMFRGYTDQGQFCRAWAKGHYPISQLPYCQANYIQAHHAQAYQS